MPFQPYLTYTCPDCKAVGGSACLTAGGATHRSRVLIYHRKKHHDELVAKGRKNYRDPFYI